MVLNTPVPRHGNASIYKRWAQTPAAIANIQMTATTIGSFRKSGSTTNDKAKAAVKWNKPLRLN